MDFSINSARVLWLLEKIIGLGNEIFVAGAALDMFALSHFLALPTGQRSFFAIELGSVRKAK